MAHIRTYRPNVRVGNWREDVTLEEDSLKDFLERKERGELTVQKNVFIKQSILEQVHLSASQGGKLCFGDVVMLVNMLSGDTCSVCINADLTNLGEGPSPGTCTWASNLGQGPNPVIQAPCGVSGGRDVQPCKRNAFIISSVDGSVEGEPLHYNQSFALRTTLGFAGGLYLTSDHQNFQKSRLQEVVMEQQANFLSWWKVLHNDPQDRLENEGLPVNANNKVIILHCKTNQALAVLRQHTLWTPFGKEYELTAHTFLDSHKAEQDVNHWLLLTTDPAGTELTQQDRSLTRATEIDTHGPLK
ncbi:cilia- and flagella-associated protein 161 isoform X2 [Esox lucius]|uniref:cilia- and flagella-associated protein 161 isoform X2 n=1 Tax=Esox lucius TaxID=8010 RepID=UPI001477082A|nr:cilia- and flagella-associated protein 161 isoform X2 [Esox lucius]